MVTNAPNADYNMPITGQYSHYKGKKYNLYCTAYDNDGARFVLYQQSYDDKKFWIRPYDMFFEDVSLDDGSHVQRFSQIYDKNPQVKKKIKKLIETLESQPICIFHSETETEYRILSINEGKDYVTVYPIEICHQSGYLSEYELVKRLGYLPTMINGEVNFSPLKNTVPKDKMLLIGDNDISALAKQLNPCSIDLQIADTGFLTTKHKLVDPQSIEVVSTAQELWKPTKTHKSKKNGISFIKLYPGKTVLTHTKLQIRIPNDCAGKIEIKSTFARLSLSITSGDFCNPGYNGFFPLELTNHGKHTIIIHENETMAQLMLIPLQGPILNDYSAKATHQNTEGYDDGTPYSFWRERSIKTLKKVNGTQKIIDLSDKVSESINSTNTGDINEFRERFDNSFLPYCQKRITSSKYMNRDTGLVDEKKLIKGYIKREKRKKSFFNIKWLTGVLAFVSAFLPVIIPLLTPKDSEASLADFWYLFVVAVAFVVSTVVFNVFCPKVFCTFEDIDLKQIIE